MRHRLAFASLVCSFTLAWGHAPSGRGPGGATGTARKSPPATKERVPPSAPAQTSAGSSRLANQWLQSLTLRDRAAQLIFMPSFGEAPSRSSNDYKKFRHWIRDLHIGGIIVNNRVVGGQVRNAEPHSMALFLNQMQRMSRLPLLVGADFERGASMRVSDTVRFPYNMAYGAANDLNETRYLGAETARQARALGVQWVYAPDADVNNNPENPIINIRSFGEDPRAVASHVVAFIEGARSDPSARVLTTVKHFPGHGDTSTDSHMQLPRVDATVERLNTLEFIPFRVAIEHHVDSVMTAHLAVPALEPDALPATVSKKIITGVLREQLGFQGIVVTDAMDMQGLTKLFPPGEASVRAVEAGVDVLLMPTDPDDAIDAIVKAVKSGRLTRRRLDASVTKVLTAKARVGLGKTRIVDLDSISDALDNPDAEHHAQQVADKALTLIKNEGPVLPFRAIERGCVFMLSEGRFSQQGRRMMEDIRKRSTSTRAVLLDPTAGDATVADAEKAAAACDSVAIAAFVTVSAYRGDVALGGGLVGFVSRVAATKPVLLVALGNPYLIRSFPNVAGYMATFNPNTTSETSVVKALFGEIPITGRMPISIPGFANLGDGIQLPTR